MNEYPLHWCVFGNDIESLKKSLVKTAKNEIDKLDLRNKTALELAIFLNRYECAKLLIEHGADCCHITKSGWNLVQESISTGNVDLIRLLMTYRDYQRSTARTSGIPELLNKLKQAPDFYVEMKWEFTSWIPLISKACPSDVYKIYKSGSNVRIDTTLVGFNGTSWERGNRSYIFQANASSGLATIIEIDHIKRTYYMDRLNAAIDPSDTSDESSGLYEPSDSAIQNKLLSPNIVTYLDIEKIEFERNKSGFFGWKTEKTESINGHNCKVYTANNLQLVTKTRVEHLNSERAQEFLKELEENDLDNELKESNSNLPGFLTNIFQGNQKHIKIEKSNKNLTALDYFQKAINVDYYLNGSVRSIDETQKLQSFNATLSLCDTYPLLLHEQVSPIVDLMALNNSHFKKLKEFITLQLPSGFPVKIEIPLYRVITAKVTFGNINAIDHPVESIKTLKSSPLKPSISRDRSVEATLNKSSDDSESSLISANSDEATSNKKMSLASGGAAMTCTIDETIFKIPSSYRCVNYFSSGELDRNGPASPGSGAAATGAAASIEPRRTYQPHYGRPIDEDDILLQLAIQQSLASSNSPEATDDSASLTALEVLAQEQQRQQTPMRREGGTQSLSEYHQRVGRLNQYNEEDLILQRILAESLSTATGGGGVGAGNRETTPALEDDAISRVLEMSKREEDERKRRETEEEEELRKVLELSLLEK